MQINSFLTPVGLITITELKEHLVSLRWGKSDKISQTPLISETVRQLNAYFQGKLKIFDLPIQTQGTPFQKNGFPHVTTEPSSLTAAKALTVE